MEDNTNYSYFNEKIDGVKNRLDNIEKLLLNIVDSIYRDCDDRLIISDDSFTKIERLADKLRDSDRKYYANDWIGVIKYK